VSVDECVHWHTPMFLEGAPELNSRLLRMAEAGMGPASFLMPEDLTVASRNQLGLQARTVGWLELARGLHRERVDAEGRTVSHVTDETTNRDTRPKLLQTGHRYSQEPASLMRRLISNIEVETAENGALIAESNFLLGELAIQAKREMHW
jgi:hypothetical protein